MPGIVNHEVIAENFECISSIGIIDFMQARTYRNSHEFISFGFKILEI